MTKLIPRLFLAAALAFAGGRASAQSLPFDSTFGVNGIASLDVLPAYNVVDVAMQRDGKILCLYGSSSYTYIIRVNANGTLDNTFMGGEGSMFYAPFPTPVPGVWQIGGKVCVIDGSLVKQTYDDKILGVFSGYSIVRLKASGVTDSTFGSVSGTPGYITLNSGTSPHHLDFVYDVYDAHEAGLYFSGHTTLGGSGLADTLLIAKTTKDGDLVSSYGTGGMLSVPMDTTKFGYYNEIRECVFTADGKLLVTGTSYRRDHPTNGDDAFIARFNLDGTYDNTFGTGGVKFIDFDNEQQTPFNISLGSGGSIFISGNTNIIAGTTPRYFTVKLTSSGNMDATFGTGGAVLNTPITGMLNPTVGSTTVTSYGKVYRSCVYSVAFMDLRTEYYSFNSNGSANTQFAAGGITNPLGYINNDSYDKAYRMITQPDNKVLIMGAGNEHPKLMRINADVPPTAVGNVAENKIKAWVAGGDAYISGITAGEQVAACLYAADGRVIGNYTGADLVANGNTSKLQLPTGMAPGLYIFSVQTREGRQQVKFIY